MVDLRLEAAEAIRKVRRAIRCKAGKDVIHLRKRQAMVHLPTKATLDAYHAVIRMIVGNPGARVFVYRFRQSAYVAVRGDVR